MGWVDSVIETARCDDWLEVVIALGARIFYADTVVSAIFPDERLTIIEPTIRCGKPFRRTLG